VYKQAINTPVLCFKTHRVNHESGALFVVREAIKLTGKKKCHQKYFTKLDSGLRNVRI
jgi:hypothetical protein